MFDAHAHLEDDKYNPDRDSVIRACKQKLQGVVSVCCKPEEFDRILELGKRYPGFVYPAAGLHPEFAKEYPDERKEAYFSEIRKHADELVAIGETGFDYHWVKDADGKRKQEQWFRESIALAKKLKKPLVVHSRLAHEETARILQEENAKQVQWHMFSAMQLVRTAADEGWMVSIGAGLLRSKSIVKLVRLLPAELLLTETDSPYVAPVPGERNTPLTIEKIVAAIAEARGISVLEADRLTTENAKRHFGLKTGN